MSNCRLCAAVNAQRGYEPGTVAVATVRGVPNVRVMHLADAAGAGLAVGTKWISQSGVECYYAHREDQVTDVRPLVVLDPDDRQQAERFARGYIAVHQYSKTPWGEREQESRDTIISAVQGAFRSLTAPPKPPEPTGLGAVVRGRDGREFVRVCSRHPGDDGHDWRADGALGSDSSNRAWRDIDAVEVLHEGHPIGWYDRGAVLQRGGTS